MTDYSSFVDRHGNIWAEVKIHGATGLAGDNYFTGANARPRTVAALLREIADDIDRLDPMKRLPDGNYALAREELLRRFAPPGREQTDAEAAAEEATWD